MPPYWAINRDWFVVLYRLRVRDTFYLYLFDFFCFFGNFTLWIDLFDKILCICIDPILVLVNPIDSSTRRSKSYYLS